jgi:hypothetical protein
MDKDARENASKWKHEEKKEFYHSTLVLEILFRYMFQEDLEGTLKRQHIFRKSPRCLRRSCIKFWTVGGE